MDVWSGLGSYDITILCLVGYNDGPGATLIMNTTIMASDRVYQLSSQIVLEPNIWITYILLWTHKT